MKGILFHSESHQAIREGRKTVTQNGLTPTSIEYGQFNWNFYPGCLHKQQGICKVPNCWAKAMARRHGDGDFKPTLHPERLLAPLYRKKPAIILVNFMGDLFGDWVDPEMGVAVGAMTKALKDWMFGVINQCHQHRFVFLTKNPKGYLKWGSWPDNCWLGASVTDSSSMSLAMMTFFNLPGHKWLSFEPLYGQIGLDDHIKMKDIVEWVVIGGQTNPIKTPSELWVQEIVNTCYRAQIPYWLKNNLKRLLLDYADDKSLVASYNHGESEFDGLELFLRQELPEGLRL